MTTETARYVPGKVEPFEALRLPPLEPDQDRDAAIRDIATAVNGFPYPGEWAEAIILAVKWLATRPDVVCALGLSADVPEPCPYTQAHTREWCGNPRCRES